MILILYFLCFICFGTTRQLEFSTYSSKSIIVDTCGNSRQSRLFNLFLSNAKVDSCFKLIKDGDYTNSLILKLTDLEKTAIRLYTTKGGYRELNRSLREIKFDTCKLDSFQYAHYSILKTGLTKITRRYSGILYRGTSLNDSILSNFRILYETKKPYIEWAFMSTSEDANITRFQYYSKTKDELPVNFIVHAIGERGVPISMLSAFGEGKKLEAGDQTEREVLFLPRTQFNIDSYQKKTNKLGFSYVEIIMSEVKF